MPSSLPGDSSAAAERGGRCPAALSSPRGRIPRFPPRKAGFSQALAAVGATCPASLPGCRAAQHPPGRLALGGGCGCRRPSGTRFRAAPAGSQAAGAEEGGPRPASPLHCRKAPSPPLCPRPPTRGPRVGPPGPDRGSPGREPARPRGRGLGSSRAGRRRPQRAATCAPSWAGRGGSASRVKAGA